MATITPPPNANWLTRKQAAYWLSQHGFQVTAKTLDNWAANNNAGNGPRFYRAQWRSVRYLESDLDEWRLSRMKLIE